MANEAVIIELIGKVPGCPIRYTCADANTIAKGTLLKFADPRTVTAHAAGADVPFAGIAAAEKLALDGSTSIAVYTNGIFDITAAAAGATAVGFAVCLSATANMIDNAAGGDLLNGSYVGQALEEVSNDEQAAIRVLAGRANY